MVDNIYIIGLAQLITYISFGLFFITRQFENLFGQFNLILEFLSIDCVEKFVKTELFWDKKVILLILHHTEGSGQTFFALLLQFKHVCVVVRYLVFQVSP